MKRRLTIAPLLLLMLIASIGMPVNVHSCAMAGTSQEGPSCGMCAASHESQESGGGGCCDNHLEIEQSDPAALSAKIISAATSPQTIATLVWPLLPSQSLSLRGITDTSPINGPPCDPPSEPTWLLLSSFLL